MSPPTMRHIFGSHALENGAQLKDVQEGLLHANIKTTSGYVHSDMRQRRRRLASAIQ
ncbi:MAG: tyrosine-type recombinase/integrase [Burkholderiaceae bacterium]